MMCQYFRKNDVGGAGSATAGDARPAETVVKAEGDRRPSNVASDSRVSVDGSDGNATGGAAAAAAIASAPAAAATVRPPKPFA